MIDLVKSVDTLSQGFEEGKYGMVVREREKEIEREHRLRGL